ncbi:hypothetical protein [Asanoa iriomotensis]|uniref:hypothetical protein n=1 Tax=Asanoa iriomotensis TaxID=234613 RepID=UPI0019456685|nr:hypothetical protein [Asanoa iriomotensis]
MTVTLNGSACAGAAQATSPVAATAATTSAARIRPGTSRLAFLTPTNLICAHPFPKEHFGTMVVAPRRRRQGDVQPAFKSDQGLANTIRHPLEGNCDSQWNGVYQTMPKSIRELFGR